VRPAEVDDDIGNRQPEPEARGAARRHEPPRAVTQAHVDDDIGNATARARYDAVTATRCRAPSGRPRSTTTSAIVDALRVFHFQCLHGAEGHWGSLGGQRSAESPREGHWAPSAAKRK
jgi:hypothetical protein